VDLSGVSRVSSGQSKADIENYACRVHKKLALPVDQVAKYSRPFDDMLWYLTGEEQIRLCLVPGFGKTYRKELLFSFGGRGLLPATFETGKVTVDVGANKKAVTAPKPTPDAVEEEETGINLDGGNDQPVEDEVDLSGSNAVKETPKSGLPAATPPPSNTVSPTQAPAATGAAAIRARFEQARGAKTEGQ